MVPLAHVVTINVWPRELLLAIDSSRELEWRFAEAGTDKVE
jgi:hypothetical protein